MSEQLPFATRVWLFLYGYPNVAGSALGLVGLILFFTGVIGPGWPIIVAGLYALGWLLAWQLTPREEHLEIAREVHTEALLEALDRLVKQVEKRLPKEALTKLNDLRATLADLLPRLADSPVFSQEAHSVEKTARDYLPATLENYLRLPPIFARMHNLAGTKTATDLLLEQLSLLDERMKAMLQDVLAEDARALAENGAFLRERFIPYDFFQSTRQ